MTDRPPVPLALKDGFHVARQVDVMGTVVTIDVYGAAPMSSAGVSPLLDEACASLREADDVFSTWKMDSPMSRIRRGEITLSMAPPEIAEVLDLCDAAREVSGGWFDPWALPGGVDPTGYVKGWAAQRALALLAGPSITGAIVNAAGDIASFGEPQAHTPFRFGIVNPYASSELICVVVGATALATSGSYERGLHLIDPHTGSPATRVASASVTGPDLGMADALATAVAVAGEEGLAMVEAIDGYDAMVVRRDGTMQSTTRFPIAAA
jgi:thiamine biosynthesis lipoprotein